MWFKSSTFAATLLAATVVAVPAPVGEASAENAIEAPNGKAVMPRAPPSVAFKPGINIVYDNLGKMRVFGAFVIKNSGGIYDVLSEQFHDNKAAAEALASSAYEHCRVSLESGAVDKLVNIGKHGDWSGIFSAVRSDSFVGNAVSGSSLGISINWRDFQQLLDDADWLDFVTDMFNYWKAQGVATVNNPVQVADAFAIGNPSSLNPLKARGSGDEGGVSELVRRTTQFCIQPTDMRQYFTNDVPTLPDYWAVCAGP